MLFSPRNVALLSAIFGFAAAQETCAYSTVTVTASLATASTSTVTIDTVYVTVAASVSTTTTSICGYVAPPPPPPVATYVSTVVQDIYVTNQVTVTELRTLENTVVAYTTVMDVVTQVSTKVDVVTLQSYYTAPPCAIVPVVANENFTGDYTGWDVVLPPPTAYGAFSAGLDTDYTVTGPQSADIVFPKGSDGAHYTSGKEVTLSQKIQICPGRDYDFTAYATTGYGNSGSCHTMLCITPDYGTPATKCSASMRLFAPSADPADHSVDPPVLTSLDDWVKVSVSYNNLDLTNEYLTVSMHTICGAQSTDHVYFDVVRMALS